MRNLGEDLHRLLTNAVGTRGYASLVVVDRPNGDAVTVWTPDPTEEPAFLVYSITKIFTAVLVLLLVEEHQLALDDHLSRWFPQFDASDRITLRQLLNHTAGVPDYGSLAVYHRDVAISPSNPWSFERYTAETIEKGLLFEPGQGWAYSNVGYMLVKRIVEQVASTSYRALVEQRIARPLKLSRTFVAESLADLAALAPGVSKQLSPNGSSRDVRQHYHPGWVSHGVVASTATDIVHFTDALFGGRLLAPSSMDEMMKLASPSPDVPSDARHGAPGYALGLMIDPESPWGLIAGHNGGGPCYSASAFWVREVGGVSVCALGAIEEGFDAEGLLFDTLDMLAMNYGSSST